jgi:hypothetical protein
MAEGVALFAFSLLIATLVPKMPHPGKDHRHIMLIRSLNHFVITH